MKNFALVGKQLSHSISPYLHAEIARIYKTDISYQILEIPESIYFSRVTTMIKDKKLDGVNITIPYKEDAIKYVDDVTFEAKAIGAINTIFLDKQSIVGANTDYNGFIGLIKYNDIDLKDKNVIILGTGGASKASLKACLDLGANVTIVTRNKNNKTMHDKIINYDELDTLSYDIIVNATPLGMYPYLDQSPLEESFVKGKTVIDLIYNPMETKLMSYAKKAVSGMDMLIIQAIQAQSLWFNRKLVITDEILNELRGLSYEFLRNNF